MTIYETLAIIGSIIVSTFYLSWLIHSRMSTVACKSEREKLEKRIDHVEDDIQEILIDVEVLKRKGNP